MISQIIQFSSDFTLAAIAFTITLLVFNIGLELYVRYVLGYLPDSIRKRVYKRFYIGYCIGLLILYLLYARAGPWT